MKKKIIAGISLFLVATLVAGGFYYKSEKDKQVAEQARIEAERLEKLEAEEKARELAEKEAKIKAQLAKEEKERQVQKAAEEKAIAEAKAKEQAQNAEEVKGTDEADEEVVVMTTPKAVAPLTGKTSKQNVTEKAVITPQGNPENKVEPKPQHDAPSADLVEHQKEIKEAELKNPQPQNPSGNIFADPSNPDNPFNNLPIGPTWGEDKSEMRELWDPSTGYGEPGTGDKF